MDQTAYAGLNVTIRILENQFLTEADYHTMLQATSLSEVLSVLKKNDYHVPDDIETTKAFDSFLTLNLQNVYQKLYESTPDWRVIDFYALKYEYHNLKVLFKEWYAEKDFSYMYIPIGRHSIEALRSAVRTGEGEKMDKAMLQGIRDVRDNFESYHSYDAIGIILDSAYLDNLKEIARHIGDPEVLAYADMVIDYENLVTLLRAMGQKRSSGFIRAVLSDEGTIPVKELAQYAVDEDYPKIMERFSQTRYGSGLSNVLTEHKPDNLVALETKIEELFAEQMREAKLQSFGPLPAISFLYYLENEITNVRLILVGVDNDLPTSAIKERMRPIYGS